MRCVCYLGLVVLALMIVTPKADARWENTQASYYSLNGNTTACGQVMTSSSWWVAHLGGTRSSCGKRVRICKRSTTRCVNVSVRDTGGHHDGRRWDLTPRVKRALRCSDLCRVRWTSR